MDLASPAVSGTSVYANGLIIKGFTKPKKHYNHLHSLQLKHKAANILLAVNQNGMIIQQRVLYM